MIGWLFLTAALLGAPARAQDPMAAQKLYDRGDYAAAAAAYAKLAADQPSEPAWQYDLGDALFKAGKLGPSVAAFERAYRLAPRSGDIRFNLSFALKRAGEELVPPGVPPAVYVAFHWLSERELAGLHWLGCWLFLLLASAWVLRPARRDALGPWAAAALALWVAAGGWWGARAWLEPAAEGVIVKTTAELRNGPGDGFSVSFTVPEGRRVEILSDQGSWLEVGVAKEGAKGWIKAEDVEKI